MANSAPPIARATLDCLKNALVPLTVRNVQRQSGNVGNDQELKGEKTNDAF